MTSVSEFNRKSEVRSEGNAAEDRLPQRPHEGTLRRKAEEEPTPLCLVAGRTRLWLSSGLGLAER